MLKMGATDTANQTFRFTHISDLHLSDPSSALTTPLSLCNKRFLGYLSWRFKRRFEHRPEILAAVAQAARDQSEHLVITGDLTQISLPAEYQQARSWMLDLGSPGDISVIPGNHDAYVGLSKREGIGLWQPWMTNECGESSWPFVRRRGPVAFIGLSSAVPTPPFYASGRVGRDQLKQLDRALAENESFFRVLLIHHSPVPGHDSLRKRLRNSSALIKILQARGVELILHGHNHRPCWKEIKIKEGYIPVVGVPAASALGLNRDNSLSLRRGGYYAYQVSRIKKGWSLEVSAYRLDAGSKKVEALWSRCYESLPALSTNSWTNRQSSTPSTSTAAS